MHLPTHFARMCPANGQPCSQRAVIQRGAHSEDEEGAINALDEQGAMHTNSCAPSHELSRLSEICEPAERANVSVRAHCVRRPAGSG